MEKSTILLVDDEMRMRKIVSDFLKVNDYKILEATDGLDGFEQFQKNKVDLVITDVMMPVMDGWELCKEIKKISKVPVIMLTARSEEIDELVGFDMGADEYISKPFSPRILVARVEAILRRIATFEEVKTFGIIQINKPAREIKVNGKDIELTFKEFELLNYLTDNISVALTREQILNSVWNYDYYGDERTVDTHIKTLRNKIEEAGNYIKTIRGIGYKFEL